MGRAPPSPKAPAVNVSIGQGEVTLPEEQEPERSGGS